MDWVLVLLITISLIAFIGCVIQIVWIRNKLNNYSQTQIGAKLIADSSIMTQLTNSSNKSLKVYSVIVQVQLTTNINSVANEENAYMKSNVAPKMFNVPLKCNNKYESGPISFNYVSYLVIQTNDSAASFIIDLQKGNEIAYIMINTVMYLAYFDYEIQKELAAQYPSYDSSYVVCLYTMNSTQNISVDTSCSLSLVPFFGKTSSDTSGDIFNVLGLLPGTISMPVHVMAILT